VFSTGPTDLGYTRSVEHEINLTDDKPYREPYRRIPPSMFDEVREHLREMLEIGAIRVLAVFGLSDSLTAHCQ
jgi:hypothetical protein